MKKVGSGQWAVDSQSRRQTASRFWLKLPTAHCLLPTAFSVSLSPVGRALLVGALLISAYALSRYWQSLRERSGKIRYALVSLRAATLLLASFALAGLG